MARVAAGALWLLCSGCPSPAPAECGTDRPGPDTPLLGIRTGSGLAGPLPPGYVITATASSYRITWAGSKRFSGSVFAVKQVGGLYRGCRDGSCALRNPMDQVTDSGGDADCRDGGDLDRIDFVSDPPDDGRGGFDFDVCGGAVYFDLLVDCVRQPDLVHYPGENSQLIAAATIPFGLVVE